MPFPTFGSLCFHSFISKFLSVFWTCSLELSQTWIFRPPDFADDHRFSFFCRCDLKVFILGFKYFWFLTRTILVNISLSLHLGIIFFADLHFPFLIRNLHLHHYFCGISISRGRVELFEMLKRTSLEFSILVMMQLLWRLCHLFHLKNVIWWAAPPTRFPLAETPQIWHVHDRDVTCRHFFELCLARLHSETSHRQAVLPDLYLPWKTRRQMQHFVAAVCTEIYVNIPSYATFFLECVFSMLVCCPSISHPFCLDQVPLVQVSQVRPEAQWPRQAAAFGAAFAAAASRTSRNTRTRRVQDLKDESLVVICCRLTSKMLAKLCYFFLKNDI